MSNESEDDFANRRISREHAQMLWFHAAQFIERVVAMKKLGMTYEAIGGAFWAALPTQEAVMLPQNQVAGMFGMTAECIASFYTHIEGETNVDRLKRQGASWIGTFGQLPEFRSASDSMSKMLDRVGQSPCEVPLGQYIRIPQTRATIQQLFASAKAVPGQSPAVECAVMLNGMSMALQGVLSETPEGGLKMLSPVPVAGHPPSLVEQFFDYDDVMVVAVQRAVTLDGQRIISS